MDPTYLYKVISFEDWEKSELQGYIIPSSLDRDFFHLATEEQVFRVVDKFWKGKKYLVLKLETKKLQGRLVYETNPGGTNRYYHLYGGTIPLDAVAEIILKTAVQDAKAMQDFDS